MVKQVSARAYGPHNVPRTAKQAREAAKNRDYLQAVDADFDAEPWGRGPPGHTTRRRFLQACPPPGSFILDGSLYVPREVVVGDESQQLFWSATRDFVRHRRDKASEGEIDAIIVAWRIITSPQLLGGAFNLWEAHSARKSLAAFLDGM